jgi:hypothetical protein
MLVRSSTFLPVASHSDSKPDWLRDVRLRIDQAELRRSYDREPFGFLQNLHALELFQPEALRRVCQALSSSKSNYYVAGGAPSAGTKFYSVPSCGGLTPIEALDRLDSMPMRILLKRPEAKDPGFRELLNELLKQILALRGDVGGERVLQLESAILITSASTVTPIHFDPAVGFFAQIEGEKIYHVYSPADAKESELERFYMRGVFEVEPLKLDDRDPSHEHVFHLRPGDGFHQPQNAPHWVETGSGRSVSYTFVYQTNVTRSMGRTRAFNHCERRLGVTPTPPGVSPHCDVLKAEAMLPVIYGRKAARRMTSTLGKRMRPLLK